MFSWCIKTKKDIYKRDKNMFGYRMKIKKLKINLSLEQF
jgi:hypothetical protein